MRMSVVRGFGFGFVRKQQRITALEQEEEEGVEEREKQLIPEREKRWTKSNIKATNSF